MRFSPSCECCEQCLIFYDDFNYPHTSGLNVTYTIVPTSGWVDTSGNAYDNYDAPYAYSARPTSDSAWMILEDQPDGVESHNVLRLRFSIGSGVLVRSAVAYYDENNYLYSELDTTQTHAVERPATSTGGIDCAILRIGQVKNGSETQLGSDVPITDLYSGDSWITFYSPSLGQLASWIPDYYKDVNYGSSQNLEKCQNYYRFANPPSGLIYSCDQKIQYCTVNCEHERDVIGSGDRTGVYFISGPSGAFSIAEYYQISPSASPDFEQCIYPMEDFCRFPNISSNQSPLCNFVFDGTEYSAHSYSLAVSGDVSGVSRNRFENEFNSTNMESIFYVPSGAYSVTIKNDYLDLTSYHYLKVSNGRKLPNPDTGFNSLAYDYEVGKNGTPLKNGVYYTNITAGNGATFTTKLCNTPNIFKGTVSYDTDETDQFMIESTRNGGGYVAFDVVNNGSVERGLGEYSQPVYALLSDWLANSVDDDLLASPFKSPLYDMPADYIEPDAWGYQNYYQSDLSLEHCGHCGKCACSGDPSTTIKVVFADIKQGSLQPGWPRPSWCYECVDYNGTWILDYVSDIQFYDDGFGSPNACRYEYLGTDVIECEKLGEEPYTEHSGNMYIGLVYGCLNKLWISDESAYPYGEYHDKVYGAELLLRSTLDGIQSTYHRHGRWATIWHDNPSGLNYANLCSDDYHLDCNFLDELLTWQSNTHYDSVPSTPIYPSFINYCSTSGSTCEITAL